MSKLSNHLGDHFEAERRKRGLSFGDLARLVGLTNVSKGGNRIATFVRTGRIESGLMLKLAKALEIDQATINRLAEQDRRELLQAWKAWADEPVPMRAILRLMAAFYNEVPVPDEIKTAEEAERWAAELARQHGKKVCLVLSRRLSVWFDEEGEVYDRKEEKPFQESNLPYMQIGNRRFLL